MTSRPPAECNAFLDQLRNFPSLSSLSEFQDLVSLHSGKTWLAPFAWSILISVSSHAHLSTHGETLCQISWKACELVHCNEKKLTLRKFDLDKLLSNFVGKLLDAQLVF